MKLQKKKKEDFKEFMNNEKFDYKTFKMILLNRDTTQPVISFGFWNKLVSYSYLQKFIRLYVLQQYAQKLELPIIDETFILYCKNIDVLINVLCEKEFINKIFKNKIFKNFIYTYK